MIEAKRYTDFSDFLSRHFTHKVQKISVNAGFTCPNRDGSIGRGGCTYCNNHTFNPDYCATEKSVAQQLEEGKAFFSRKYPSMGYLAYFQAYTNTYDSMEVLRRKYEEALGVSGVQGLVVGTRPDCVSDELLDYFAALNKQTFVLLEYGVETVNDRVLRRINRGHDFSCSADAIRRTAERGIPVGVHMILGLPGETRDGILRQAEVLSDLPLDTVKLHQLQLIKGTRMAQEYEQNPQDFCLFSPDEYAELVADYLERLDARIAVERFTSQSPKHLLMAPDWKLKNHEFVELVKKKLKERNTCQGRLIQTTDNR